MNRRLPVTVVGGFLGSGKTSLLHHFIGEHGGGHLAVLVENIGTLNLDAKALRGLCGAMRRSHDAVLEIPASDDAAQVEWIAATLRELSEAGRYERVLIEAAGTTIPARLAEHFLPDRIGTFSPWAELEQIVCVVDALDYFRMGNAPAWRNWTWPYLNEQIASATLVVLNKCDLLQNRDREWCAGSIPLLHATARVIETSFGELPPEIWSHPANSEEIKAALKRRSFRLPTGYTELPVEPELAATLYRAYRPFHPGRFWDWYNAEHPGLLRVKGIIWLATRSLLVGGISRTHWQNSCGAAGIWWAALPREEWPEEPEALKRMQETWREPYGDRRQELALVGEAATLGGLHRQLDACLLTEEEYARPFKAWSALPDPFPVWDLEDV